MNNISSGVFVRQVEQVNSARCMGDIDNDIADLPEAMCAFIDS